MASTASWVLYNIDQIQNLGAGAGSYTGASDGLNNVIIPVSPYYFPSPGAPSNNIAPGQVSQSGNTVTGSGTYFLSSMVGWTINFLSNSTSATITSVTSKTSMTVNISQTIGLGTYNFTIPSSVTNFNNITMDNINGADNYNGITIAGAGSSPMILIGGNSNNSYSFWIGAQHNGSFNSLTSGAYLISIPAGSLPSGASLNGTLSKYYTVNAGGFQAGASYSGGDYTPPKNDPTFDSPLYDGQVINLDAVWKSGHAFWYSGTTGSWPFSNGTGGLIYGGFIYPATYSFTGGANFDYDILPYFSQPLRLQLNTSGPPIPKTNINISNFIKYYWSET